MRRFKSLFIKNSISMLVIVITIVIGIYIITQYKNKEVNNIKFPKNKYNDALKEMIHYVIERDY